jgi:hypothetical protein
MIVGMIVGMTKGAKQQRASDLHGEDGEDDDVVADFALEGDHAVVVGVVPGHGCVRTCVQQVLRPAPLFCIITPVTEYLKGLLSLQRPLMTKSMRLLMLALAFSLL